MLTIFSWLGSFSHQNINSVRNIRTQEARIKESIIDIGFNFNKEITK